MNESKKDIFSDVHATVIYIAEAQDATFAAKIFKSIENQTFKNFDVIVSYIEGQFNIEDFEKYVEENVNLPLSVTIKYYSNKDIYKLLDSAKDLVDEISDFIFIKTAMPNIWSNNHILSHIEDYSCKYNKKKMFQLSNISVRDINYDINHPFGAIAYRIEDSPKLDGILLDEISFRKQAVNMFLFSDYLPKETDESKGFKMKEFFTMMKTNGVFVNKEITIYQLINIPNKNIDANNIVLQNIDVNFSENEIISVDSAGNVVDETFDDAELFVVEKFPTVCGNKQWDEKHNDKVKQSIKQYIENNGKKYIKKIAVKRTMGMGDVILTQPFVKYLTQQFPDAEIHFHTLNSPSNIESIYRFADCNITDVKTYENKDSFLDILAQDKSYDLRYDLDLAYESRQEYGYSEAYFRSMGYDIPEEYNIVPKMTKSIDISEDKKMISFCPIGSGWPGKEMSCDRWKIVLSEFKQNGYKIHSVSNLDGKFSDLREIIDYENMCLDEIESYKIMIDTIESSCCFVGSDNGPMHIATALDKPILIVSGAALLSKTTAYKNYVNIFKDDLECIGCKHRFFFDIIEPQPNQKIVNFVPQCTNTNKYECMVFDDKYLISCANKMIDICKS
jgi:ADP-heptose:LPS heptosyltransferase